MTILGLIVLGLIAKMMVEAGINPLHAWIGLIVIIILALFAND